MQQGTLFDVPQTTMGPFAETIFKTKYALELPASNGDGPRSETWRETSERVSYSVLNRYFPGHIDTVTDLIENRKFLPGGRYLYASGRKFPQTQNCLLLTVDDSREGWGDLMDRVVKGLMTGAGVGVVYSALRGEGSKVNGLGGKSTGPLALMNMVNEAGRHVMQGGSRRSAIWAGLHWNHPDVFKFCQAKDWSRAVRDLKEQDFSFPAPLDMTNISVILDTEFFEAYENDKSPMHSWAQDVYWTVVKRMCKTGEPGFSVDAFENEGENLRNACTEITSYDDNDICNLGSLNLANFTDKEEFAVAVEAATTFLLAGTLYSTVPYEEVADTREKNRRLGLGLMGIHEWLLMRDKPYGPDAELEEWLKIYQDVSDRTAAEQSKRLGISAPVKVRAIAPTGTIAIIAETTSGIEPVFCAAFRRRYLKEKVWHAQYVVDATAKRLVEQGVDPSCIEDAYDLAKDVKRRIKFQAWVQQYVDHGISSTINLPEWGSEHNNQDTVRKFGETLMTYLPQLRGITTYPDGARGGQPLTKIDLSEALDFEGIEFEEHGNEHSCVGGSCGI